MVSGCETQLEPHVHLLKELHTMRDSRGPNYLHIHSHHRVVLAQEVQNKENIGYT